MNLFKTFGAGLSVWGGGIVKHWKLILLGIVIVPIAFVLFCILIALLAAGMVKLLMMLVAIQGFNNFCNQHPREIAAGIFGGMILFVILHSLYQDGKKKLLQKQNDKIPSI